MQARKFTKENTLAAWRAMRPNQPILPHFAPIPYKSRGSSYGACVIRIDGSPEFIDAVLSRLQDLTAGECIETRLELARRPVDGSGIGKALPKAGAGAECCYIRLHRRGDEGAMLASYTLVAPMEVSR